VTTSSDNSPTVNLLPFHPIADMFPLMEGKEFDELVGDIQRRGLGFPIVIFEGQIIDGRNRARACQRAGVEPRYSQFEGKAEDVPRFIVSANIHRRHLKPEIRQQLIKRILLEDPTKSDRALGAELKVDHKTVGAVRRQAEATGEISPVEKRTGKDGKARKQPTPAADAKHAENDQGVKRARSTKEVMAIRREKLGEDFAKIEGTPLASQTEMAALIDLRDADPEKATALIQAAQENKVASAVAAVAAIRKAPGISAEEGINAWKHSKMVRVWLQMPPDAQDALIEFMLANRRVPSTEDVDALRPLRNGAAA
jgi:hypothetical protein